ncbi:MAG: hypothetical protein ACPIOQ_11385, partial [Promethearchaeia archaeon]
MLFPSPAFQKMGMKEWIRQQKMAAKAAKAAATLSASVCQPVMPPCPCKKLSHTDSGCHVPRCCHAPYCAASVEGPTSRNAQLPEAGTVVQHVTLRHRGRAVRGVVV